MIKKQTALQVTSLVSGFVIHMTFGATYTLGTITPYMASYLFYHGQPNIKVVDLSLIYPINQLFQSFGIAFSMIYLQKKITYRPLAFIGMIGFVGSYFITTFTSSLIMYLLFYATLAGLFQGVTYMIPFLNCYQYLPNRKGLSSGICMTAYGVGSFLFNWIIVKLVNPDNESPNSNHIFSQKVADKFPVGLRYMCILYLFIGVIGCTLIFQKKSNKKVSKNQDLQDKKVSLSNEYLKIKNESIVKSLMSQQNQHLNQKNSISQQSLLKQGQKSQEKEQLNTPIGKLLKSKYYYQLILIIITSVPFGAFIAYNYKQYGQTISKNDHLITLAGSIGGVSNSLSRVFWCFLFDYFSFKKILLTMAFVNLGLIIGFCFNKDENLYIFLTIATYFFYGANFGIYPTQTVRIYGQSDGSRIYPFIFGGFTTSATLQFVLHYLVLNYYGDSGFKYCFVVFGILQLTSIIFLFKFDFKYKQYEEKKQNSERNQTQSNKYESQK